MFCDARLSGASEAHADRRGTRRRGDEPLTTTVDISGKQLQHEGLAGEVDAALRDAGLPGRNETALVRTIIALAEMLTLRTIAEGVEDSRQHDQLRALGCQSAQGFLFSRPVAASEIDALLDAGVVNDASR